MSGSPEGLRYGCRLAAVAQGFSPAVVEAMAAVAQGFSPAASKRWPL
jgi:hypothetical protein